MAIRCPDRTATATLPRCCTAASSSVSLYSASTSTPVAVGAAGWVGEMVHVRGGEGVSQRQTSEKRLLSQTATTEVASAQPCIQPIRPAQLAAFNHHPSITHPARLP